MSTMKLMMASITVKERTRVARAAFMDPLTASANCWLVAIARYLGMLAADVAASSAALQLASKSSFALTIAFWASVRDSCSLKAMKMRESIGYASHVNERR